MKIKLLILSLLHTILLSAQTNPQTKIDSTYKNYFSLSREIPYLQLNKTKFTNGEEVWFKAYILDFNTKKLHKNTSNLHCYIFDDKGKLKNHKLLFIKDGVASGSFKIDSSFISKNYFIKATTNYMKNFREDESYTQKITIINNKSHLPLNTKEQLDFQLLPEGGHLIANSVNSLGILVKNWLNKGIYIKKGEILENGIVINSFSTNRFGLSKVKVYIDPSKSYKSKITLSNNTVIIKKFPTIQQKGINIIVNNPNTNVTEFILATNKLTLPKLKNKNYTLLIHNGAHYIKRRINFKKNIIKLSLLIKNEKLQPGTNIISLFNENNQVIAERIFFNYNKKALFTSIKTNFITRKDSSTLILNKPKSSSKNYYLSASILPAKTKSYEPSETIFTKFLISPYIKGTIENPIYYFKNINRKKLYDLDLLLLTQGWSKFDWYHIFNNPPSEQFEFDKGITIYGTINSHIPKGTQKIVLVSNDNDFFDYTQLNNSSFNFKNLYLKDNSNINISLVNPNKKLEKIKAYIRYNTQTSTTIPENVIKTTHKNKISFSNNDLDSFINSDDYENLNEVTVQGKIEYKNTPITATYLPYAIKVEDYHYKNLNVMNFLRIKGGFKVVPTPDGNLAVFSGRGASFSANESLPSKVYLDGTLINGNIDLISNRVIGDFEEVFYSKDFRGEIHLFTLIDTKPRKKISRFSTFKIPLGYALTKEYYSPKYHSTQNNIFKEYGAVSWIPNILLDKNTYENKIKFDHFNLDQIKIYIEGITDKGQLIRSEKTIHLKK